LRRRLHLDFFANFVTLPVLAARDVTTGRFERDHRSQGLFRGSARRQLRSNAQQLLALCSERSPYRKGVTLMQARLTTRAPSWPIAPQPGNPHPQLDFSLFRQFFLNAARGQLFPPPTSVTYRTKYSSLRPAPTLAARTDKNDP